jgi:threonine/homoserine/homoserine lactone efflux protein
MRMDIVVPGAVHLEIFVSAALVMLLIPGPVVLYVVGLSAEQGRVSGLVSILGVHAATLVDVVAATLGLSAVVASSELAFGVVKYAGAAYLIWLGLRKLFAPPPAGDAEEAALPVRRDYARLFRDGFVVNILNPKMAVFFVAFLPQFVDPARGHPAAQLAFLGVCFLLLGLATDSCYALAAGTAGNVLRRSRAYLRFERYVSGALLVGLGVTAALAGGRRR